MNQRPTQDGPSAEVVEAAFRAGYYAGVCDGNIYEDADKAWAKYRAAMPPTASTVNKAMLEALALADETLMQAIGAFPLPGHPLRAACLAIRAFTGDDYNERKRLAAIALAKTGDAS